MDQPQVSVKAWNNYRHWDKGKGGLNVQVKDPAQIRREKLRKVIFFVVLGIVVAIIVIAIIVSVILYNLPEEEIVTRVPPTLKRFDPESSSSSTPKCDWPYIIKDGNCDFVIQDNKACNFDMEDCEKSDLCIDFKATLTCEESKELGPFYPQCNINSGDHCSNN